MANTFVFQSQTLHSLKRTTFDTSNVVVDLYPLARQTEGNENIELSFFKSSVIHCEAIECK